MMHDNSLAGIKEIPLVLNDDNIDKIFPDYRQLVLFLDFDGTLSPIVSKPEEAFLLPGLKEILEKCALKYIVAVVSGRDTDDVARRIGIDGIVYAGSHGFSIKGPRDLQMEHEKADEIHHLLIAIEQNLAEVFSDGPEGLQIERKKYAITIHYRNVDPNQIGKIKKMTEKILSGHTGVKMEDGRKIIEIKPDIDWNKGKALKWILEKLNLWNDPGVFSVYVGDDVTDEDAFRILQGKGIGIIVSSQNRPTAANFRLVDVNEVRDFLKWLSVRTLPEKTT
jgi:trehalose 6-phosphate phosphatase